MQRWTMSIVLGLVLQQAVTVQADELIRVPREIPESELAKRGLTISQAVEEHYRKFAEEVHKAQLERREVATKAIETILSRFGEPEGFWARQLKPMPIGEWFRWYREMQEEERWMPQREEALRQLLKGTIGLSPSSETDEFWVRLAKNCKNIAVFRQSHWLGVFLVESDFAYRKPTYNVPLQLDPLPRIIGTDWKDQIENVFTEDTVSKLKALIVGEGELVGPNWSRLQDPWSPSYSVADRAEIPTSELLLREWNYFNLTRELIRFQQRFMPTQTDKNRDK